MLYYCISIITILHYYTSLSVYIVIVIYYYILYEDMFIIVWNYTYYIIVVYYYLYYYIKTKHPHYLKDCILKRHSQLVVWFHGLVGSLSKVLFLGCPLSPSSSLLYSLPTCVCLSCDSHLGRTSGNTYMYVYALVNQCHICSLFIYFAFI